MTKVGVFTDNHGQENLRVIKKVFDLEGITHTLSLGDLLYKTQTEYTGSLGHQALQFRAQLLQDSPIRTAVMEGLYSDTQLENILSGLHENRETADAVAAAEYRDIDALFDHQLVTLGGNWDRTNIATVFNDRYLNGRTCNMSGLNILGLSGSGSPHPMTLPEDLLADNPYSEVSQSDAWKDPLLLEDKIDLLAMHLPPTDGEGNQKENGVEYGKKLLRARKSQGKEMPGVIISGHRHGTTRVEYNKELDTWWVQPGVSALNHNNGAYACFVITEFNDTTQKLERVKEYRIYNSIDGLQQVELHGIHTLDHNSKKVNFEKLEQKVIEEINLQRVEHNLKLDPAYKAMSAAFNPKFIDITPQQKDTLLRQCLSGIDDKNHEIEENITLIINFVRRNVLCGRNSLSNEAISEATDQIHEELAKKAAESFGINYSKALSAMDETKAHFFKSVLTRMAFGISEDTVYQALDVSEGQRNKIPHNWGNSLIQAAQKYITQTYQQHVISRLDAQDFQEMAEIHMPQNYERSRTLEKQEAINLWAHTYRGQTYFPKILTPADVEETGAYKKNKDFTGTKRTKKDIADLLGIDENQAETQEPKQITTDALKPEHRTEIKDAITSGRLPVFSDTQGEYLPLGQKLYLTDEFKQGLVYTPTTEKEYVSTQIRAGQIAIVEKEGKEYLLQGEKMVPFERAKYGLQEGEYRVLDEEQMRYQRLMQQLHQTQAELQSMQGGQQSRIIAPPSAGQRIVPPSGIPSANSNERQYPIGTSLGPNLGAAPEQRSAGGIILPPSIVSPNYRP